MAGNKVNAKAKGKDDKGKGGSKSIVPNNEEIEDADFSLLRKPIHTSVTSFGQARKIFDMATEELKTLLSEECDLLYECRVCRNLFRSLANFISHKRVFCKEKFNNTVHGHFIKSSSTLTELSKIKRTEEGYQEWLKDINGEESMETDEVDERIPLTKDLTAVIEKLSNKKGVVCEINDEPKVTLQKIPNSNVAVFQNIENGGESGTENMRSQVNELDTILCRNVAVLQDDGRFKIESSVPQIGDNVIQISDDEDTDLKCKKCGMQFSTLKTLKFHMKCKHVDTRLVYPCPDCLEIFSTSWSVHRHLFKVHRKTPAQIRRLRESIQAKAFKMNNPPAFYEKRKNIMKTVSVQKITEEERLDQENQAWMDNMECDGEVPRCGGCGRGFERRAALAAHTHTCPPRSRALRRPDKRIEIQIRRDYNKGPQPTLLDKSHDANENKVTKEAKEAESETEQKKKEVDVPQERKEEINTEDDNSADILEQQSAEDQASTATETVEKDTASPEKSLEASKFPEQVIRLPFAQHAEKSNLMALRQRVIGDVQLEKLLCKKCDIKCENIQELYDHVAKHYKWLRYACKLCNFKHYHFEKLPEHVKIVHKLKGDKDFYFSTVKAIDGIEAIELAEPVEENTDTNETSPNSRRPSRCSSDSSRLSDDSSSSSARVEGAKKRKIKSVTSKSIGKRMKSLIKNKEEDWPDKEDSPPNSKAFEENSSDMDDTFDKVDKKIIEVPSVASRRPVRRRTKPKNADFEYDLSNLLKMEAQGYRESQTVTTKSSQTKKKPQPEPPPPSNYEIFNKECSGALATLSRRALENAKAHMKTSPFAVYTQKEKATNIFARPLLPKTTSRGEKVSPKKDNIDEKKDTEEIKNTEGKDSTEKNTSEMKDNVMSSNKQTINDANTNDAINIGNDKNIEQEKDQSDNVNNAPVVKDLEQNITSNSSKQNSIKPKSINIPAIVPVKFKRQSLEVIKNPLINKNITDFTKAGLKTKILVIKPINRKSDGSQTVNTPLKFQTIKLKESNKPSSKDDKHSDQVVVVKVPKVDCITRSLSETTVMATSNEKSLELPEKTAAKPNEKTLTVTDKSEKSMQLGESNITDKSETVSNKLIAVVDVLETDASKSLNTTDGHKIINTDKPIEENVKCINSIMTKDDESKNSFNNVEIPDSNTCKPDSDSALACS